MSNLQAVPLPQRPLSFRERAMTALETHQGADLVSYLAMLHDQAVAEADGMAAAARASVVQVAAAAAVDQQMLASVLSTVVPMLRTSGENAARAAHFAGLIEAVRTLLQRADAEGAGIDGEQLRTILNTAANPAPFRPMVLGFVPSTQYRAGTFRHITSNVEWVLPFSGFSLCEESADRPMTAHAAFLHRGVVRPQPQLYVEHGFMLEHLE